MVTHCSVDGWRASDSTAGEEVGRAEEPHASLVWKRGAGSPHTTRFLERNRMSGHGDCPWETLGQGWEGEFLFPVDSLKCWSFVLSFTWTCIVCFKIIEMLILKSKQLEYLQAS